MGSRPVKRPTVIGAALFCVLLSADLGTGRQLLGNQAVVDKLIATKPWAVGAARVKDFPEKALTQPTANPEDKLVVGRAIALLILVSSGVLAQAQGGEAVKLEKPAENVKKIPKGRG